jgi:hypothetical protein
LPSSDQNRHFTYFCFSIVEVKYFVSFSRMTFPTFPFFVFDRWFCFGKNGLLLFVNVRDIGSKPLNYVDAHGENKSHQVLIGILRHQTQQEKLNNRSPYGNEYQYYIIITCLMYLPTVLVFILSSIYVSKNWYFNLFYPQMLSESFPSTLSASVDFPICLRLSQLLIFVLLFLQSGNGDFKVSLQKRSFFIRCEDKSI